MSGDAPIHVVFIDAAERIDAFLHAATEVLSDVVVVVEDVEIVDTGSPASGSFRTKRSWRVAAVST